MDGQFIYLADAQRGALRRMDLNGGLETLAQTPRADDVVWDEAALYWVHFDGISTMPATGGAPTLLVAEQLAGGGAFALDSTHVYWVDRAQGTLSKKPRAGGTAARLASGLIQPTSVAVDGMRAYVTTYSESEVLSVPLEGGAFPTTHASGLMVPHAIVAHTTGVYWGNRAGGTIMRLPLGGGAPQIFDRGQNPEVLVFGRDALYWLSYSVNGFIQKVPLDGSAPSRLATGIGLGKSLAVTDNCVYWVDSLGNVMHVKR